ncbi:MAG: hypothetical protein EOP06_23000, partial [Proteobacteria bacterium]
MLKKNIELLHEIEGMTEEECLQWYMENFEVSREQAAFGLAVARGQETYNDIRVFSENGERLYSYDMESKEANGST